MIIIIIVQIYTYHNKYVELGLELELEIAA